MNRSVARALEFLADMEEDYDLSELAALPFVLSARLMVSIYCQEFSCGGSRRIVGTCPQAATMSGSWWRVTGSLVRPRGRDPQGQVGVVSPLKTKTSNLTSW